MPASATAADTDATTDPVRSCALQPYAYPIMPLPSTTAARETLLRPCASDYHESVIMRLSWPPARGVALPLGWRGLRLAQVIALAQGFLPKHTCERVRVAAEAGAGLHGVMAAGQEVPLRPSGDGIAAALVPVSALRTRQALLNGARACANALPTRRSGCGRLHAAYTITSPGLFPCT